MKAKAVSSRCHRCVESDISRVIRRIRSRSSPVERQGWFVRWYENEAVCRFEYEVASRYEALRHHPMFQREAAALRAAVEGLREFSALIHPIDGDDPQKRDRPRTTAPWPVTEEGKVAA